MWGWSELEWVDMGAVGCRGYTHDCEVGDLCSLNRMGPKQQALCSKSLQDYIKAKYSSEVWNERF